MNPVKALQNIRSVVAGESLLVEHTHPSLPTRSRMLHYEGAAHKTVWWSFSTGCLQKMIEDAGFDRVEIAGTFTLGHRGERSSLKHVAFRAWP
jgi:hypothetical protein